MPLPASTSKIEAVLLFALGVATPRVAEAEPLRLREDALVQTRSPVGLVVMHGEDRLRPWLDVETVTWLGVNGASETVSSTGDVVTLSVRARDASTGSELRVGRMVVTMGAIRPVHVDGAMGRFRAFEGTTVETFGGFPVVRRFDYHTFDWTAGGRLGHAVGDSAAFGASYAMRRRDGQRDDEEVGGDLAFTPSPFLTAAARSSFDLTTRGLTDVLASISMQKGALRGEVFTTHRSPGRLLPSSSLFSVLGDFAATSSGATFRWRAAPRLELMTTGSVQAQGGEVGGQGLGRATLAWDDEWTGSLAFEARRVDFNGSRWTGAKAILSLPLAMAFRVATELEIVRPDEPRGRGAVWPWALAAVGWTSSSGWEVSTGVEASSGPAHRESVHALARLSYGFGSRAAAGGVPTSPTTGGIAR